MHDLVFKNLVSKDKKIRRVASIEIAEQQGLYSIVKRHFICIAREIKEAILPPKVQPYIYILKERNKKEQKEKLFCRIKGSIYVIVNDRLFLILYAHSLKIILTAEPQIIT